MEATIRNVCRDLNCYQKPYLDIQQCFDRLTPLPSVVLDTCHIFLHTSHSSLSIGRIEESRTGRFVWKKEVDGCRPCNSESTEQQEHSLKHDQQAMSRSRNGLTFHGWMLRTCPTPYASTPPKIPATTFPINHAPCLKGCSDLLYHMATITVKPGPIAASAAPTVFSRPY